MPFMHWVSAEPECGLISTPEYGTHGLTCYYPGTTNLIISVPHGGEMRPPFIADRKRPASGKSTSEGNKVTKLTKEENTLKEEENKLLREESKKEESKPTKEENTKEGSKSTKEGSKSTREENKLTKEGVKKGSRLTREESSDPDEDTAGRITTAADIYTQVRKHPHRLISKVQTHSILRGR